MKTIFDLPAHPLFVHFPIAFAPLVVLGVIAMLARPAWRRPLGPYLLAGSVVALVALVLARQSGEEMFELLDREPSISKHEHLANQSLVLWLLFVVVLAATVVVHRRSTATTAGSATVRAAGEDDHPANGRPLRNAAAALALATVALGVVSTVWIARTGHEGAKSHWSFVNQS